MLIASNTNPHELARQASLQAERARLIGIGIGHALYWAVAGFRTVARIVQERAERQRAARELYRLDDRMLSDIGLSRADIRAAVLRGAKAAAEKDAAPAPVPQDNRPTARAA